MKTVAIIGGGFSGTLTAVNLARLAKDPLRIVVVNHGPPLGRGVAYSTKRPEHLLNVAARNMSAFPDQPNHFVDWLGTRSEYADVPEAVLREQFMPRKIYGDYVQSLLFWYGKGAVNPKARIEAIHGETLDIVPGARRRDRGRGGTAHFRGGTRWCWRPAIRRRPIFRCLKDHSSIPVF